MDIDAWPIVELDHTFIDEQVVLSTYERGRQIGASTAAPGRGVTPFVLNWLVAGLANFGLVKIWRWRRDCRLRAVTRPLHSKYR